MSNKRSKKQTSSAAKRPRTDESDDYDHMYDDEASISLSQEKSLCSKATPSKNGIIEFIKLENFMCHSKLLIDFGPNINFVCGRNGCGKSAILTALVFGLGGAAATTDRGKNAQTFIKTNENTTKVTIQLRNRGEDSYKPQMFGDSVIIERSVNINGNSTYKMKSKHGHAISNRKRDVQHMLDDFNIQIDNPICILNQDTSRGFLNSANPRDKYKFFLKATQLGIIQQSYKEANESNLRAKEILKKKKASLPEAKKDLDKLKFILDKFEGHNEQEQRYKVLSIEYAWALVKEKEILSEKTKDKVAEMEIELEATNKKHAEVKSKIEKLDSDKAEWAERLKAMELREKELDPLIKAKEAEKASKKQEALSKASLVKSTKKSLLVNQEDMQELQKKINEMSAVDTDIYLKMKQEREGKIETLEGEKTELKARLATQDLHLNQLKGSINESTKEKEHLGLSERALQSQINNLNNELSNLEGSKSNHLRKFGQKMPDLLRLIDQAHKQGKFSQKPKGPIGSFISVKDSKWALAVECCLGFMKLAFACNDHNDEKVLRGLFNRVFQNQPKPPIIVCKFVNNVYDVSSQAVCCKNYHSVLNEIIVSDPVITNFIIDQVGVYGVLLIDTAAEARENLLYTQNIPRNCTSAYTMNGDRYFPAPSFRSYSEMKNSASYLSGSVEEKIKEIKRTIEQLTKEKSELSNKLIGQRRTQQEQENEKKRTEVVIRKLRERMFQLDKELSNLRNIVDPDPTDFTALKADLEEYRQKHIELKIKEEKMTTEFEEIKVEYSALNQEVKDLYQSLQELQKESDPIRERLINVVAYEKDLLNRQAQMEVKFNECKKRLAGLKKDVENLVKDIENMSDLALRVGDQVEIHRKTPAIEKDIKAIDKWRKERELLLGTKTEAMARYMEAKKAYREHELEVDTLKVSIENTTLALKWRGEAFILFRKNFQTRCKMLFNAALTNRNYRGKLIFDHNEKKLHIHVQPNENVEKLNEDSRSLSGGERSFSTVCFILALWDVMESPFRMLDEYDVFMDSINRTLSMEMMQSRAEDRPDNQFIFFTPLDMNNVKPSRLVKLFQMPDPERKRRN